MAHDGPALPLTPAQLDIWLAQQSGRFGTEWQLGLFVRIAGPVQRDPLQWAIRRVLEEAEHVIALPLHHAPVQRFGPLPMRVEGLDERFDLQPVARGGDGLEVVELVPRQD